MYLVKAGIQKLPWHDHAQLCMYSWSCTVMQSYAQSSQSCTAQSHLLYHFDWLFTSHITRPYELNQFCFHHASQGPVNILKIGIAGIKKNLGTSCQFYEQFRQRIHSVMHHHWLWTSVPVNYVRHASQGVNDRSKWYSNVQNRHSYQRVIKTTQRGLYLRSKFIINVFYMVIAFYEATNLHHQCNTPWETARVSLCNSMESQVTQLPKSCKLKCLLTHISTPV